MEDWRALFGLLDYDHVIFSVHPYVQGRSQPQEDSPIILRHQNCLNLVQATSSSNGFVKINNRGVNSWVREGYLHLAATISPQDPKRKHLKVRRFPNPAQENWLVINGSPYELARNQLVALLDYDRANHMVYVGFALPDGRPMQGWVRDVNLRSIA